MPPLTQDEALSLFRLDIETGRVYWRVKRGPNSRIGSETGLSHNSEGYRTMHIKEGSLKVHRLIWLMVYGDWPLRQIDHINGNRSDNRPANLRLVTNGENQQNRRLPRIDNSTSKHMGVGFFARNQKWRARIQVGKKSIWLGYFDTEQLAAEAYQVAKTKHHPFFPFKKESL